MDESVCGIVVTYHPRVDDIDNLSALRRQVQQLIVVDNGSPEPTVQLLRHFSAESDSILIENGSNRGIAAALNTGIRWAKAQLFSWVVLLDQDSSVPEGYVNTMLRAFEEHPLANRLAILVPQYRDTSRGIALTARYAKRGGLEVAMTSGSLMPTRIFEEEGGFEEELFIDGVDYEYCLRVRRHGWQVDECKSAILDHEPAAFELCTLLGVLRFAPSNYSPVRRYYRARNILWMAKAYGLSYPGFCFEVLWGLTKDMCKALLAEQNKWVKIQYTLRGLVDGMQGRMGPIA